MRRPIPAKGNSPTVRIGTSGWSYPHWKGPFYPPGLPAKRWFSHYAEHFGTVEVNNTFYQLPSEKTFLSWRDASPPKFLFTLKLSRMITHQRKLNRVETFLETFLSRTRLLGTHLGPILVQLPPRWSRNPERLEAFLGLLPSDLLVALEFRDPSWFHPGTYEMLDRFGVAFCRHDMEGVSCPRVSTGRFRYVRFHGTTGKYGGRYSRKQLEGWVREILADPGELGTFVYFNNDEKAYAVINALELMEMLSPG